MLSFLDPRDIFYSVIGLALFGMSFQPALRKNRLINIPLLYVLIGVGLSTATTLSLDPRSSALAAKIVEHASELIVIISLAGAGLAIDAVGTWKNWQSSYRLLIVAMPLTILAIAVIGAQWLALPIASAILLAACLAPTDPVLAQSVQVGPPGEDETPMEVALTAEAGLNDGLAFPFVYLAITLAALTATQGEEGWFLSWLGYDFAYRVVAGWVVGYGAGYVFSRIVTSRFGDASQGGWNSLVVVLASTLIAYGFAEAANGYGFLAVFAATRAGRANTRGTDQASYEKIVHHGAEQLEAILLALLLLWFGMFVGAGALAGWTWAEVALAAAIIFVIRPAAGLISLIRLECSNLERVKVAFFGVRGMGSIFYIAYAQNHADFAEIDAIWRIAALTILGSIIVHGFAANFTIDREDDRPALFRSAARNA